jgi:hypothetical protein
MSSRKEEKERLRREREEAERAAMASESRRKRIAAVLGGVLLAAVAVIVVLAVTTGDDEGNNQTDGGNQAVPAKRISDLDEAARAAGCEVAEHPNEGRGHSTADQTYRTNPPTSGTHDPVAAQDGFYPDPPDVEQSVHSLEHGRVNIQWKPGTPANRVNQLETIFNEEVRGEAGYHTLAFENQTEMTAAVAATGWTHSLTCPEFNDRVFDAIRAFREEMIVGEFAADIPELQP